MLRVDVYSFNEDPKQVHPDVFLWFTYKKGDKAVEVHFDFPDGREPHMIKDLKKYGIFGRKEKNFKLTDKEKFLNELRFEFTSSRMRASKPYEVEQLKGSSKHHKWHWPIEEIEKDGFIWFDRICQRCGRVEHLKITLEQARIIEDFVFGT